ncbi:hypothetical protein pEaSNUABM50_00147 [Erwinia phage pEa_SNUABM_50]|uniref:Uncharacterized protein n=4 Tax=Eneladusvirus BF TaxID=2560751 RepID=A0A7L8ZN69_9CAUD|nr:hypothetical protein FDH34_gp149 [Serratia phage BF]QOI71087.1 hypothetical protein pEaSNUABM12_00149 [Erwinia phage pEa_SNUABM_12]QOI71632.1 hypothetical protein pEaSNUABM47_00148 [Erwinia phage pEa_SNUABM_47]QOI72171.1 hypothetical protein pEaSNUABM50_00147 [Erwinia phage pEa_SNUABM_50]QXO11297.1 hypothetical protein pEaSNUABM19_00151 [Erwinia phage pEa_SNUABM_19]QXO11845.1 hypothetical protein pEaSNUABM44_00149 [Erwinia phage pEa_SNUABM_44]QXO12397.1 hypothetical protein pEaSNUABM49_001
MKRSEVLFAILRKSKKVLEEFAVSNRQRKFIIEMKYNYSKLQPTLRNMMRIMATDIERFELLNEKNMKDVLENFHLSGMERPECYIEQHPALIDINTGKKFIIKREEIISGDVVVFKDAEHKAFIVAYNCLVLAKENQEIMIRTRDEEEKRQSVLSEYQ